LLLQYNGDFSLDDTDKWLLLKRVGTSWEEIFRSYGNDPAAERTALAAAALAANTFTGVQRWAKGADVASAGALTLGTDGNYFDITGTTSITSIATLGIGTWVRLHFDGALTLTHHATDLILPSGANITTAAGDEAEFIEYASGDWRCVSYTKASGQAVVSSSITLGTPTASTSGTSIDYTSLPAGTKRITVDFSGVSTSGTSNIIIQIGDSGGIENTGYLGNAVLINAGTTIAALTAGFPVTQVAAAGAAFHGRVTLNLMDATNNTWASSGCVSNSVATTGLHVGSGAKSLTATLDRVRITTVGGADTFDAGTINITYE
jgi:hypothetical protein